ncbi:MAG: hypothetical protein WKF94_06335 [Solirubrobacteraceae bacterium]
MWLETASDTFTARHDERDTADAELVLRALEDARPQLQRTLEAAVGPLDVVLHGTEAQLDAAAPLLPLLRRLSAPAARRYVVGWAGEHELHVMSPRVLAKRASNVEGSLELLMLSPTALLARRIVTEANPALHPRLGPRMLARYTRSAWLLEGAAQYFSGQVDHARPGIAVRLREGPDPAFPPGRADAILLGGSVYDLLAREEGTAAAVALAQGAHGLKAAFHGRPLRHTEVIWRAHLQRMAEGRLPARRPR